MRGTPVFFASADELRRWFERHHGSMSELVVGFYKKASGRPSVTYPEALDEALCVGWIDGVRRSLDAERYTIRFTPRRPRSIWSAVNMKRAAELIAEGRMTAAGRQVYEDRDPGRSGVYSYERQSCELASPYVKRLRTHASAWRFFQAQPPSYRRVAAWYVMSAKKEETRQKRLERLIADSAAGRRLGPVAPEGTRGR